VRETRRNVVLKAVLHHTRVLVIEGDAAMRDAMVGFLEVFGGDLPPSGTTPCGCCGRLGGSRAGGISCVACFVR
jgi:hypothetical protein